MTRSIIVSAVAANPNQDPNDPKTSTFTWKIGGSALGDPDLIVQQMIPFNGGVSVFALPSPGSKTELSFIQQTGTRQGFIFHLAAATIKMTIGMASADEFEEIRRDTFENADDNFDESEDPDEDETDEEEESDEEDAPQVAPTPAPPAVAPAPQPSFLPAAETLSDASIDTESP